MNEDASLLCHVNLANGFRGGERQTMLLIQALSEKGFKQKLIARKDSELTKRSQYLRGLDVIETNYFGLNAFSKVSEKSLFCWRYLTASWAEAALAGSSCTNLVKTSTAVMK